MALCHITGTVQLPDGTNAAGRILVFTPSGRGVGVNDGNAVISDGIPAKIARNGGVDLNLYSGRYDVAVLRQRSGVEAKLSIDVPDQATADIADLIQ